MSDDLNRYFFDVGKDYLDLSGQLFAFFGPRRQAGRSTWHELACDERWRGFEIRVTNETGGIPIWQPPLRMAADASDPVSDCHWVPEAGPAGELQGLASHSASLPRLVSFAVRLPDRPADHWRPRRPAPGGVIRMESFWLFRRGGCVHSARSCAVERR